MKCDTNIIAERWKKRYDAQSLEIQKQLDDQTHVKQLRVIKRSRVSPQKGDLFLVSPIDSLYFYGVVINSDVNSIQGEGRCVIAIFKDRTSSIESADVKYIPDFSNLLIGPAIVSKAYWTKGYFFTIGNVFNFEMNCSYGFFDVHRLIFVDEYRNELSAIPSIYGIWGVATYYGIAIEIRNELLFDCNLTQVTKTEEQFD